MWRFSLMHSSNVQDTVVTLDERTLADHALKWTDTEMDPPMSLELGVTEESAPAYIAQSFPARVPTDQVLSHRTDAVVVHGGHRVSILQVQNTETVSDPTLIPTSFCGFPARTLSSVLLSDDVWGGGMDGRRVVLASVVR